MDSTTTANLDLIFSINFYFTGAVSIVSNIAILWLIKSKSPANIREYRFFLANLAVTDVLLAVLSVSLQNRQMTRGQVISGLALGPARYLGSQTCWFLCTLFLTVLMYEILMFPLIFIFRYIMVCKPHLKHRFSKRNMLFFFLAVLSLCFLYFAATILSAVPTELLIERLNETDPYMNFSSVVLFGTDMSVNKLGGVSFLMSTGSNIVAYIVVVFCAHRIIASFHKNLNIMQERTRRGHLSLIRALLIQATFPLICIFPGFINMAVTVVTGKTFLIEDYIGFALLSWISVLDPFVTVWSVRPYRRAVFFWLAKSENSVVPSRTHGAHSPRVSIGIASSPGTPRRVTVHSITSIAAAPRPVPDVEGNRNGGAVQAVRRPAHE